MLFHVKYISHTITNYIQTKIIFQNIDIRESKINII